MRLVEMNEWDKKLFWAKVDKTPGHGPWGDCWLWTKSVTKSGYAQHGIKRKLNYAHRISWVLFNGRQVPDSLLVLHRCDIKICVNPNHLFIGTHLDNTTDMIMKNRMTTTAKLTSEQLKEILNLRDLPAREVASRYGVSWSLIFKIWRREFSTRVSKRIVT